MAAVASPEITLDQFVSLPGDAVKHEVSLGLLITMPPAKSLHALVANAVLRIIQHFIEGRESVALCEAGYVLCANPLIIRQPDISVLSKQRVRATSPDSYFQGAPELAIEVISPSNDAEDMELKIAQYLQYGAIQVWVLYPKTQRVHIFAAGGSTILNASQKLDGGSLLPGFSIAVSDLFAL
jgi:Uma2 family endonuclease